METISDKQVGDLLRGYAKVVSEQGDHVRLLIRKLVEERAQNHFWAIGRDKNANDFLNMALDDFGIPAAEWEHPNG